MAERYAKLDNGNKHPIQKYTLPKKNTTSKKPTKKDKK